MNLDNSGAHKFEKGRRCKHCKTPIPDDAHGLMEFCERVEQPDGSIKSCKDDYHTEQRRIDEERYRKLVARHKLLTTHLNGLLQAKGNIVTLDQLSQYEVRLQQAV